MIAKSICARSIMLKVRFFEATLSSTEGAFPNHSTTISRSLIWVGRAMPSQAKSFMKSLVAIGVGFASGALNRSLMASAATSAPSAVKRQQVMPLRPAPPNGLRWHLSQTALLACIDAMLSLLKPSSAKTSSVCSPSKGEPVISTFKSENLIGLPTVM
jgi:hypothetical protein